MPAASIIQAGDGVTVTPSEDDQTITIADAGISSGNTLSERPSIGDRFRLLQQDSFAHDPLVQRLNAQPTRFMFTHRLCNPGKPTRPFSCI